MKRLWVMVAVFTAVFFTAAISNGAESIKKRYPGMCTDISNPIDDAQPEGFIPCDWYQAGSSPTTPSYVWNSLSTPLYTHIKDWNSNLQLDVEKLSTIMSGMGVDYRAQVSASVLFAAQNFTNLRPVMLDVGDKAYGLRVAPVNNGYFMVSATSAANTVTNPLAFRLSIDGTNWVGASKPLPISDDANPNAVTNPIFIQISQDGTSAVSASKPIPISDDLNANAVTNPIFTQLSQDGTSPVDATHPLPVSKDLAVNSTSNRIWVKSDIDMIAGTATNVNGGAKDTGTQTVILATDDPAVTALQIIDDWDATHDSAASSDGPQVMFEARTSRGTAVASGDAVRPITNEYGEQVGAGFTWATNSDRTNEVNPVSEHYNFDEVVDVTNGADATHDYYVPMSGYRDSGYQVDLDCDAGTVTVKVYCTLEDDCAPGSCGYQDVSQAIIGAASLVATAGTAEDLWIDNDSKLGSCKYVHIEVVAATGGTTGDWKISGEKHY